MRWVLYTHLPEGKPYNKKRANERLDKRDYVAGKNGASYKSEGAFGDSKWTQLRSCFSDALVPCEASSLTVAIHGPDTSRSRESPCSGIRHDWVDTRAAHAGLTPERRRGDAGGL